MNFAQKTLYSSKFNVVHLTTIFDNIPAYFCHNCESFLVHFNMLASIRCVVSERRRGGLIVSVSDPPVPSSNLGPGPGLPTEWSEALQIAQ